MLLIILGLAKYVEPGTTVVGPSIEVGIKQY